MRRLDLIRSENRLISTEAEVKPKGLQNSQVKGPDLDETLENSVAVY